MTREERYLVLKDLCGRLMTNVIVTIEGESDRLYLNGGMLDLMWSGKVNYRPYLRPMSSMTEKEKKVYDKLRMNYYKLFSTESSSNLIDWLNANHFDYCIDPSTGKTLIESGLAIEAPEGMYKIK